MSNENFRFDPVTFQYRPVIIVGHVRQVQHFAAFNRVGFFLSETPQRLTTNPISIICGGDPLGEVPKTATPGEDNFRVDYGNVNNFASTGFVEIHVSRIGQVAVINQRGLGVNLNSSHRDDARANIQRSVSVATDVVVNSLTVPGSFSAGDAISAGMQRIRNISTVSATDLINLMTFLGMTARTMPQILTGSGNWPKPANVTRCLFVSIGPGGNGSTDSGGGGGSVVYGVADLDAIGGTMFAYVVGLAGIATTIFGCSAGSGAAGAVGSGGAGGGGSVGVDVVGKAIPGAAGGSGIFVSVSIGFPNTYDVQTSPDGITWTPRNGVQPDLPAINDWQSITYGAGLFLAVGSSGDDFVMTSPDAITWTPRTAAEFNQWRFVTFANNMFLALAIDGTSRVMTSPDGITWTARTAAAANEWRSVVYAAGQWVAVASSGGVGRVMTSLDGITWTLRTGITTSEWFSITYGAGLYVAVGGAGADKIMTSPDGITWTSRSTTAGIFLFSVTYANGLFVAVASTDGSGNYVYTSPDGITWTARAASGAYGWHSVTYGNGLFVATSNDGSATSYVMTSPDGVTWTNRTAGEAHTWSSVIYTKSGAGGSSPGGLGGRAIAAENITEGITDKFFAGNGGHADEDGELYGGGAGANGNGADGLILLFY